MTTLISIADLKDIFQVSAVSLSNWRQRKGLELHRYTIPGRNREIVRFDLTGVLNWAKENGKETPGLKEWKRAHHEVLTI